MSYTVRMQCPLGTTEDVRVTARSESEACRLAMRQKGAGWLPIFALAL